MQSGPPGRARGLAATGGGERGAGDTSARSTPRTCSIHLQGGLAWAIGSAAIGFGSSPWLTDPDFSSSPSQPCSSRSSRPWAKAWCGDRGFISARNALSDARIAWMFSMPMKAICVFG